MGTNHCVKKRIVFFVAGKSGGHIIPALTHATHLHKKGSIDHAFLFLTGTKLDQTVLNQHNQFVAPISLPVAQVPYLKKWSYPAFFIRLWWAFCISLYYLITKRPMCVISMGGLVSLPVCYAARLLRIPFELYELNVIPGKATAHLAPWATHISICFEQTKQFLPAATCHLVDYPLRFDVYHQRSSTHKKNCPTLFIIGGSQGSISLNRLIKGWLTNQQILSKLHIIHQAGTGNSTALQQFYTQLNISAHVFEYHPQLEELYLQADVVVTRAGAGALFEALFFKKQTIVIPLETHTTTHQKNNAHAIAAQYPDLFTVLTHKEIAHNPSVLYTALDTKLKHNIS